MPNYAAQACTACGTGGTMRCTADGFPGPCQPATATTEACGNGCDEDRDGEADEFCAESQTFDYCALNPNGTLTRWRCACSETSLVGRCLGSSDPQTSCANPGGCLKAPAFGSSGASQAGGDYACCVSNLPCNYSDLSGGNQGYVLSAFQCSGAVEDRFECRPGQSCADSNQCGDLCIGIAPTINTTTGARSNEGAYCQPGDVCGEAQSGLSYEAGGGVRAFVDSECPTIEVEEWGEAASYCSAPGFTPVHLLPVPQPREGTQPPSRGGGGRGGGRPGSGDDSGPAPAPSGDVCGSGAVAGAGVSSMSVPRVALADLTTRHEEADVGLQGTLGGFNFIRKYVSTDKTWAYQSLVGNNSEPFLPKPFGASPSNVNSLRWWHALYSFVQPRGWIPGVSTWGVRDTDGAVLEYEACSSGATPCFAKPRNTTLWSTSRLYWSGSFFVLFKEGEGRYIYQSLWTSPPSNAGIVRRFFLSRIETEGSSASGSPRVRLTLQYAPPPVSGCPGLSTQGNGVPYLATVTTEDGAKLRLSYRLVSSAHATPGQECVLDQLFLLKNPNSTDPAQNQQETVVATYGYPTVSGQPRAGLLSSVAYPETGDAVSYSDTTTQATTNTSWAVSVNGGQLVSHAYVDQRVATAVGASGSALAFSTGSGSCGPSSSGSGWSCPDPAVTPATGRAGDAAGTSVTYRRQFSLDSPLYTPYSLVNAYTDQCLTGNCASFPSGSAWFDWMQPAGGTVQLERQKNKNDGFSLFDYVVAEGATASPVLLKPLQSVSWLEGGDFWGNGAVYSGKTEYAVGQLATTAGIPDPIKPVVQSTDSEDSVLQAGEKVYTRTSYDEASRRLKSIIRSGYTEKFDSATGTWSSSPVAQHVGVFYFNHHKCSGETDTGAPEVREVHGPCAVSGPTALDCDVDNDFPITQYDYYDGPSIEHSNRANRLKKMSRFISHAGPGACAGHPKLETSFTSYDERGNVLSLSDARGVQTDLQYVGGRITQTTTAGLITHFTYDGAQLTDVQLPAGNHSISCYRINTISGQGCVGGQTTALLQWVAMAADAAGADWSEKVVFTYWSDGAVKTEEYLSRHGNVEEMRRKVEYHQDAHQRPTYVRSGVGAGSFAAVGAFDKNGNLTGIGLPSNAPPDFCAVDSSGQPLSQLCTALGYDKADRLTHMAEFPAPSVEQHSAFTYDKHGNVGSIQMGCASPTGCSQPMATYRYDDFGNLLQVELPHSTGPIRYAYDAGGNVRVKQTESMRLAQEWLAYSYDSLSRTREVTRVSLGGSPQQESLYRLGYDNEDTLPSGCERYAGEYVDLQSWGLQRYREDSLGRTWFRYDSAGRLIGELRVRQGELACRAELETRYYYDSFGRLEKLRYPYERFVTYVHGTGANAHRVVAVDVSMFLGSGQSETRRLVSDAIWEPFGGLRGYQLNPSGGLPLSVEYALGDDGSVAPSGCDAVIPSAGASDLTGRLRAVWVSRVAFIPGTGVGDVYKRIYTWQADQVARIDTCLLGATTPRTETYSYDRTLRLTGAGRPAGNFSATGGAFSSRTYGYDRRGNRVSLGEDGFGSTLVQDTGNKQDQLLSATSQTDSLLSSTYTYDADGRGTQKVLGHYPSGAAVHTLDLRYGALSAGGGMGSARETVFRSVQVNGLTYSYYYDALGRRRAKVYPSGVRDEFFHSVGDELLVDQGSDSALATSFRTVDDYVWLGGRPVVLLRGKLDASLNNRLADSSTDCRRNGEAAACGAYFPVTDHIGKPVLMLDSSGLVTGAADYEPFGHSNRVTFHAKTPHPYPDDQSTVLATFSQPRENSQVRVRIRTLFHLVDTEQGADVVELVDGSTSSILGSLSGPQLGRVASPWVEPSAGQLSVRFTAGPGSVPNAYAGVIVEGYEYQRFQVGTQPFWTPLRFPGQYSDAETELFENWNRYYDPSIGRYLQPEPMLQMPGVVLRSAASGLGFPAYAYALNNTNHFIDATGLSPTGGMDTISAAFRRCLAMPSLACWEQALTAATGSVPAWFERFRQAFDAGMRNNKCQEVASAVADFFRRIGGSPQFIAIRAKGYDYMSLDLPDGTSPGITQNGYHIVVQLGDRIYDAFTGPGGMAVADYMANLQARYGYTWEVVTSP